MEVLGYQWYWGYYFLNSFDSFIISPENSLRLLDTDQYLQIPNLINIKLRVRRIDVLHSWTIPRLLVKVDGCPGRINQIIFKTLSSGFYLGQCSELCGSLHSFIPILLERLDLNIFIALYF